MLKHGNLEPYASGADMWREYVIEYGIIPARIICNSYLNMHEANPDADERLFCEQLREGMAMGLNTRHVPIYLWSEGLAELNGETTKFIDSMKAFEQCAEHIDQAIHASVFGNGDADVHFNFALAAVVDHHGSERVEIVLKCAVLYDLAGRYPADLRNWVRDFKKPDHFGNFGIRTRPAVLVGLINELCRQEADIKMEHQITKTQEATVSEVKPLIKFIDSNYRELFKIPDGEKIRITYPLGDDREPVERVCKFHGETHFDLEKNGTLHICQFAEMMERIGARYEPVNQLQNIQLVPFTAGNGEDKFYTHNREEGHTCTGSLQGDFGNNGDGDRFSAYWRETDNGLYNGEIQSELQSVVYALRQDLLKDRASMLAYCQSHPNAKLLDGKTSHDEEYSTYGFKLETESRQYFVNCFTQGKGSRFSVFAYAYKPTLAIKQEQTVASHIPVEVTTETQPLVTVTFSECNNLRGIENMPLYLANDLFGRLDAMPSHERSADGAPYDKTDFRIDFVKDGKPEVYTGHYDVGDGDGTLIEPIRGVAEYQRLNEGHQHYLAGKGDGFQAVENARLEFIARVLVPIFEKHCEVSQLEASAMSELMGIYEGADCKPPETDSPRIAHLESVVDYAVHCREALNTTGLNNLPEAPASFHSADPELNKTEASTTGIGSDEKPSVMDEINSSRQNSRKPKARATSKAKNWDVKKERKNKGGQDL